MYSRAKPFFFICTNVSHVIFLLSSSIFKCIIPYTVDFSWYYATVASVASLNPRVFWVVVCILVLRLFIRWFFFHHFNNVSDANPFNTSFFLFFVCMLVSNFVRQEMQKEVKNEWKYTTINHFLHKQFEKQKLCVDAINFSW